MATAVQGGIPLKLNTVLSLALNALLACTLFAGDAPIPPPPKLVEQPPPDPSLPPFGSNVKDVVIPVTVECKRDPATVTLRWAADKRANKYMVFRRNAGDLTWPSPKRLNTDVTSYEDTDVAAGKAYEYAVVRTYPVKVKAAVPDQSGKLVEREIEMELPAVGCFCVAVEAPLVESRGGLLLLVDKTQAEPLKAELARLEEDLAGDGWTVVREDVDRAAKPPEIKALIKKACGAATTKIKTLFLFGHVPVPYSGDLNPDGHGDHKGAWPADSYYADLDGEWTDSKVNNATASRAENKNIPGDGKFDHTQIPTALELQLGRVDLANMPAFKLNETELLRQYLNRDHAYRHKAFTVPVRGLVDDNFGTYGGGNFAANAWRNFGALAGESAVSAQKWFATLNKDAYLFAYGCGAGSYHNCSGVGDINGFAANECKAVFTMLYGSYFGDWDVGNCFLRGPLAAAGHGLTVTWTGSPAAYIHQMGMGETIGYAVWMNLNNVGSKQYPLGMFPYNPVCITLLGDPTLRLHPIAPPQKLTAERKKEKVTLRWSAPVEEVLGYHVYRADGPRGPFTRINKELLTKKLEFKDDEAEKSDRIYMVRAVKLQKTPSGSYHDASQGIFVSAPFINK